MTGHSGLFSYLFLPLDPQVFSHRIRLLEKLRRFGIPYDFCTSVFRAKLPAIPRNVVEFSVTQLYLQSSLNATVVQTRTVAAQFPVLLTRPGVAQAFVDKSGSKTGEA
jgi:hypothetical protein